MPKNSKTPAPGDVQSGRFTETQQDGSQAHPDSEDHVTPTSERVIKETSVKRREAMKVLANR